MRNVTIKPETTKRQDDVTGRLPRYTRYTSPRMMKAQARVQDSTMGRQKNVLSEVYNFYKLDEEFNLSDHLFVRPSQPVSHSADQPARRLEGQSAEAFSPIISQSVSRSVRFDWVMQSVGNLMVESHHWYPFQTEHCIYVNGCEE